MNITNYSGDQSLFSTVLFTRLPPFRDDGTDYGYFFTVCFSAPFSSVIGRKTSDNSA
jgi:hypothetical protein